MEPDDLALDELLGAAAARERARHVDPEFVQRVELKLAEPHHSPLRASVLLAAFALACVVAVPQLAGLLSMDLVTNLGSLTELLQLAQSNLPQAQGLSSGFAQFTQSLRDTSSWLVGAAFMLVLVPLWNSAA